VDQSPPVLDWAGALDCAVAAVRSTTKQQKKMDMVRVIN
jgi:hypothetical protein